MPARDRLLMAVLCVLPARLQSVRLPRKPLQTLAGRPLVEWSWRAARRVESFEEVWVATDSEEVARVTRAFGARTFLTDPAHVSGTDRVAEVAALPEARPFDFVVNYQADEPFLEPAALEEGVRAVGRGSEVATLATPIVSRAEWDSEAVVKVVRATDGRALYFSRAPVPRPREREPAFGVRGEGGEPSPYLRHVGVYFFRRAALERWVSLPESPLERLEKLEQLRALEAGMRIQVVVTPVAERGIDEPGDLVRAEELLERRAAG